MAKVTAPLLSFDGSGQIGKSIVFGAWRGIQTARRYVIPANPKTAAQTAQRSRFATLREFWKRLSADGRAPWDAYAAGRPFLGLNAFVGENRLSMGLDTDMANLVGSPGARGGIPLGDLTATGGVSSGEIDFDFTMPSLPTGWTITESVVVAAVDQDPVDVLAEPPVSVSVGAAPWDGTVTGLTPNTLYSITGWAVMTKPDGQVAYSPSITVQATSTA